jgi:hypothetical protein
MRERQARVRKTIRRTTVSKTSRISLARRSMPPDAPRTDRLGRVLEEWLAEAQIRYTHPGE